MLPSLPKSPATRRFRHRIAEIELNPTISTHDISLVLLIDGSALWSLPKIVRGKPLRWKESIICDVAPDSKMSLEILEHQRWSPPFRLKAQDISVFDIQESSRLRIGFVDPSINWVATIKFLTTEEAKISLQGRLEKLRQLDKVPVLPKSAGKIRKILSNFAFVAAEVHPSAELVILGLVEALEILSEQDQWNEGIRSLVNNLVGMIETVQEVEKTGGEGSLKDIVESMMNLFEDVSIYVSEHKSNKETAFKPRRAADTVDRVKILSDRFEKLKAELIAGTGAETHKKISMISSYEFLRRLQPTSPSGYDRDHMCQDGTRNDVIDEVIRWTKSLHVHQKLLWVRGQAGIGKSSIAASVCERLNNTGTLAACFFCKRDDDALRDPLRLISNIAHGLATRCPEYGRVVANAIKDNMEICDLHMDQRYEGLIQRPLRELQNLGLPPLIIVIDALDECGSPDSQRKLLGHLQDMAQLVPWLRLIVTSRPTKDIQDFFHNTPRNAAPASIIDLHKFDASPDVRAFIERNLLGTAKRDSWPSESINRLCERADGLFIWAAIATRYILGAIGSTGGRLGMVLGDQKSPLSDNLDQLYTNILLSGTRDFGDDNKALVRQCMGAIVIASTRQPLSITALSNLLRGELDSFGLEQVVKNLGSILYLDEQLGGAVRFYHPSFADYITDSLRSGDFHVELGQQNYIFAKGCLRVIQEETCFNICELKTSYLPNDQVHSLPERINTKISRHLSYGCLHWISHTVDSPPELLQKEIQKIFVGPRSIFWLEVLSLINRVDVALMDLPRLTQWLPESSSSIEFIRDIHTLVSVFHDAIATSTPHLYVSALPLCPEESLTMKALGSYFPKRVGIRNGGNKHWPRWLRAITHPTQVMSLAVDPTGQILATGCYDGTIHLWNLVAGIPRGDPLYGHSKSVTSLDFSPDGARLVSGSVDTSVRMWDIRASKAMEGFLINHSNVVTSVAFSSGGSQVISGSWDGTIQISSAKTGEPIDPNKPLVVCHPNRITALAISPDHTQMVYSPESNTAIVRDIRSGKEVLLVGHSGEITSVTFSRDGVYIISGSADMTVRLWESKTGDRVGQPFVGHSGFVTAVAFSPAATRLYQVATTIVSGSWDKTLRIWATETNHEDGTPPFSRFASIVSLLLNTHLGLVMDPLATGHADEVSTVVFSPDGLNIVSGSYDRTARVWDAKTGNPVCKPFKHNHAMSCLAISPTGDHIITGSGTRVCVWEATKEKANTSLRTEYLTVISIASILLLLNYYASCSHAGPWADGYGLGGVDELHTSYINFFIPYICAFSLLYSMRILWIRNYIQHTGEVTCIRVSPDGKRLFSSSRDGEIRVCHIKTGGLIGSPLRYGDGPIAAIACTPNRGRIVSSSSDNTVRIWDIIEGKPKKIEIVDYPSSGGTTTVSFAPDGNTVAFAFTDNSIRLWNLDYETETSNPIGDAFFGHSDIVRSIAFSPTQDLMASGSDDMTVRLWDIQASLPVGGPFIGHSGPVRSIAFSPSGFQIASGSSDGTIRVWSVNYNQPTPTRPSGSQLSDLQLESLPHGPLSSPSLQIAHPGWYSHDKQALLLWLPDHYRRAYDPRSLICISASSSNMIQFNFSEFAHGENWVSIASQRVQENAL